MNINELHKYLISIAARSPAKKRKVGAVIAYSIEVENEEPDYCTIASGYNYNVIGGPCEGADGVTSSDVIHAEAACIDNFNSGVMTTIDMDRLVMYVTHQPCDGCKAAIMKEGITYKVMSDFLKFDDNKPRMSLVPPSLNIGVAEVLTYGAKKYKPNNWRKTKDIERYINALERHLCAWKSGESKDPESGFSHLKHIACNIAFLIELEDLPRLQGE